MKSPSRNWSFKQLRGLNKSSETDLTKAFAELASQTRRLGCHVVPAMMYPSQTRVPRLPPPTLFLPWIVKSDNSPLHRIAKLCGKVFRQGICGEAIRKLVSHHSIHYLRWSVPPSADHSLLIVKLVCFGPNVGHWVTSVIDFSDCFLIPAGMQKAFRRLSCKRGCLGTVLLGQPTIAPCITKLNVGMT